MRTGSVESRNIFGTTFYLLNKNVDHARSLFSIKFVFYYLFHCCFISYFLLNLLLCRKLLIEEGRGR